MGKGDARRPTLVTQEELDLRWEYAKTNMTMQEFTRRYNELKEKGLIKRRIK